MTVIGKFRTFNVYGVSISEGKNTRCTGVPSWAVLLRLDAKAKV